MDLLKVSHLSDDILAEIKRLHFFTRRLANDSISGEYKSAYRGHGIEFEEVRNYSPGDDVRLIDWKVTARSQMPFIKLFREERELTVMIVVDVSASTQTGTRDTLRASLIAKIGAVLTLIAQKNNDKVGLITYSDRVETYHPPRKARSAVWRILHEVLSPANYNPKTDLAGMFSFLNNVLTRRSIVFIISDFIGEGFEKEFSLLGKRHDVTAIQISDPADFHLPYVSLINLQEPESHRTITVDTRSKEFSTHYFLRAEKAQADFVTLCRKCRVGLLEISTNTPFITKLRSYFDLRARKYLG